jgi:hypothetical protein
MTVAAVGEGSGLGVEPAPSTGVGIEVTTRGGVAGGAARQATTIPRITPRIIILKTSPDSQTPFYWL